MNKLLFYISQIFIILLLLTQRTKEGNCKLNAEHIFTVCDMENYSHAKLVERIGSCNNPALIPDTTAEEFFKATNEHLSGKARDVTFNDETLIRRPWDKSVIQAEVQKKEIDFRWLVNRLLTRVAHVWNRPWYGVIVFSCSLSFFLHGLLTNVIRPGKMVWYILLYILMGLILPSVFFIAPKTSLYGLFALLIGRILLYLTAPWIKEKLILLQVMFLLPFVQMFKKAFGIGQKNERMVEDIRMKAQISTETNKLASEFGRELNELDNESLVME